MIVAARRRGRRPRCAILVIRRAGSVLVLGGRDGRLLALGGGLRGLRRDRDRGTRLHARRDGRLGAVAAADVARQQSRKLAGKHHGQDGGGHRCRQQRHPAAVTGPGTGQHGPQPSTRDRLRGDRAHDAIGEVRGRIRDRVGQVAIQIGHGRLQVARQIGLIGIERPAGHAATSRSSTGRRRSSPRRRCGLHRVQGTLGNLGDLLQAHLAEEAQRDHLAVGISQAGHRQAHLSLPFAGQRGGHRIGSWGAERQVRRQLGGRPPLAQAAERLPRRDAHQPAAQRPIAAVGADRSVGHHEALLGHVLGVVGTAEDAQAGAVDGDLFALHQEAEGVMVAVQDGIDETAVVHGPIVPCGCAHSPSVVPRAVVSAAGTGVATVVVVAVAGARVVVVLVVVAVAGAGVVLVIAAARTRPVLVLAVGLRTLGCFRTLRRLGTCGSLVVEVLVLAGLGAGRCATDLAAGEGVNVRGRAGLGGP